jgi:Zn-finger nucleic acid-binding protein
MNCPGCGAALAPVSNRNHLYCSHCGSYYFPQETGDGVCPLGDPASVACPVCTDKPLQTALIDGERVCYCDHCRGFLTKIDTFGMIVTKRRANHGPHEQRPGPFDPAELKRRIKCPACKNRMEAHPYFGGGNAVVDTCERCRLIWLDAGELAVIERYIPHVHHIEAPLHLPGATESSTNSLLGGTFLVGGTPGLLDDLF